ncbi:MAG TPA: protein kinase [Kofleriaceae bacterium]|nr:protein kinase [Kofleriaceae bacterium]
MSTERSFGRYRVTAVLGAGAMGEVFAAVDDVLGREVAVKTLKRTASGLAARLLDDRFRQEARAIAALHHPGVVQVFDLDLAADPPFLVMERVAGPSLKERLSHGALAPSEIRALGIQVGRALAAAHAANIIHRDVKPANILGAGPGQWKLADFGVAHVPDSSLTMTGQFVGSPAYAPPEALIRGVSGAAGDVYGLGATLYEAAAGRWPRGEAAGEGTIGALLAPVPPLASLAPALPADVAAIIDRAVAVEPDQRPTADVLADVLAGAASLAMPPAVGPVVLPAVAPVSIAPAVAAGGVRLRPWLVGGAIVAVLVLVATRLGGGSPAATPSPSIVPVMPAAARGPSVDDLRPPPDLGPKEAKDWNKIRDELRKGNTRAAREKLDHFESQNGTSNESNAARDLLGNLDAQHPPGPEREEDDDRDDHDHEDDRPEPPDPHGPDAPHPPPGPHHGRHHH